jgi:hypothetical protein
LRVPLWDYASKQDFEPSSLFVDFFFPDIRMSIVNLFVMKPHRWGRLSDHYDETLQLVPLFETLLLHRFERVFPRLFAVIARLCLP